MQQSELRTWIDRYQNASFTVMKKVNNEIRNQLRDEISLEQYSILRYSRDKAYVTSTELAEIFHVGKSAITSIITKLADKNLVHRLPDPHDRRVIRLEVTDAGRALSLRTDTYVEKWLARHLEHFRPDEIESFVASFEKLAALVTHSEEGSEP